MGEESAPISGRFLFCPAAGTLTASNLKVYSVPSLEAFQDGTITDDEKLDSGLLSNSSSSGAITLSGNSEVHGEVTTPGTIVTSGAAQILGETIEGGDSQEIPNYKATDFDPSGLQFERAWNTGEIIDGARTHQGNLVLSDDLEFADGMLYVNGNVTITGTLHGFGALVATGDIHVTTGQMDLANDINALVAGGDIVIDGLSPDNSTYKGIVYSEKSIEFKRTTVIGASVSADPGGSIEMEEVKAITAPRLDSMLIEKHITLDEAKKNTRGLKDATGFSTGVLINGTDFTPIEDSSEETLKTIAASLASDENEDVWKVVVETGNPPPNHYQDAATGTVSARLSNQYWSSYVEEHKLDNVIVEKIFEIDLNRALSLDGNIEVWLRKTRNYN